MGIFHYIFHNNIPEMIYYQVNLLLSGMLAVDSQSIEINNIIFVLHSSPIFCMRQEALPSISMYYILNILPRPLFWMLI